jgi:hypothetical protein
LGRCRGHFSPRPYRARNASRSEAGGRIKWGFPAFVACRQAGQAGIPSGDTFLQKKIANKYLYINLANFSKTAINILTNIS